MPHDWEQKSKSHDPNRPGFSWSDPNRPGFSWSTEMIRYECRNCGSLQHRSIMQNPPDPNRDIGGSCELLTVKMIMRS